MSGTGRGSSLFRWVMEGAVVVVGTTFVSVATVSMRSSGSVVDIASSSSSSSFSVNSGGSITNVSSAFDPRSDVVVVVVAVEDEDDDDMAM